MISVIIPARNEQYLSKTVDDAFAKAEEEIEIIVVIDGPTSYPLPAQRKNLTILCHSIPRGKRVGINHAASVAKGDYLLMADAHCMFSQGYDRILQHDCDKDWVVILRRRNLNARKWEITPGPPVDYYYLSCPWNDRKRFVIQACPWVTQTLKRMEDKKIDETMTFQGSMCFTSIEHFQKRLEGLEVARWGTNSSGDWLEIGMKTWMCGGKVMINKKGWYAHLHKARWPRGYILDFKQMYCQLTDAAKYWTGDKWEGNRNGRNFGWLVDHFWPLPELATRTFHEHRYWPENWREYYEGRLQWQRQV
jgi:glycosyltransferase involved in cell wall biosynthesis